MKLLRKIAIARNNPPWRGRSYRLVLPDRHAWCKSYTHGKTWAETFSDIQDSVRLTGDSNLSGVDVVRLIHKKGFIYYCELRPEVITAINTKKEWRVVDYTILNDKLIRPRY